MSLRLMTCLLLLCASMSVAAGGMQRSGANGDGGTCPEVIAAGGEEPQIARAGKPAAATARNRTDKPAVSRGGDQNTVRPPRWHSFLPGMFR
jgi:hypothetical protein